MIVLRRRSTGRKTARLVVALALVLIGIRIPIALGITVGAVISVGLSPYWWRSLAAFRGGRLVAIGGAAVVVGQLWLTEFASIDRSTSFALLVSEISLIVGLVAGMGVILWAREMMSDAWVAGYFGAGLLLNAALLQDGTLFTGNAWKFGFSTAIAVIGLALAQGSKSRLVEVAALIALAGISAISDARSATAILFLALIITIFQFRPTRITRRASATKFVLAIAVSALIVFNIVQTLILDGYLGDAAQARSIEQIDTSGSLVLGGRPELAATLALMAARPIGYGAGVVPSLADVTVAKTGMAAIGYQPNNGYVENYMFGGRIELHSVIGDLWARGGVLGLFFLAIVLGLTIRAMSERIAANSASALSIYLAVWLLWNLFFSPWYSSVMLTTLLVGMLPMQLAATNGRGIDGAQKLRSFTLRSN